ncbi:MAG TPA: MarR family winged helix-turn-helix transcriptional regulator [Caulobacteraceae bacterium]|jgi:DNA-binding MarR family transcriptional regulator
MSKDSTLFEDTLEVRDACLCLHAQRTARSLARRFDEAFRPLRLTSGQFSLLNALNGRVPPTLGHVAELLAMDRTTVTAGLKPLERRGLVETRPDPHDGRTRRLALSVTGAELLAQAIPVWRETHARLEEGLAPNEPQRLRASFTRLCETA